MQLLYAEVIIVWLFTTSVYALVPAEVLHTASTPIRWAVAWGITSHYSTLCFAEYSLQAKCG